MANEGLFVANPTKRIWQARVWLFIMVEKATRYVVTYCAAENFHFQVHCWKGTFPSSPSFPSYMYRQTLLKAEEKEKLACCFFKLSLEGRMGGTAAIMAYRQCLLPSPGFQCGKSQLDVPWSTHILSTCMGKMQSLQFCGMLCLHVMQSQGKIIIFSWFDFKSMTSMQFQTVEEVEDVCKLLSLAAKYSRKKPQPTFIYLASHSFSFALF